MHQHVPVRHRLATILCVAGLCAASPLASGAQDARLAGLQTRAERTNFVETSRYDDVQAFLATVDAASSLVHVTPFGYTFEGRQMPLAVVGRVADARPATAKASGLLRVYVQANIHAGEVEGKEAILALVRDLARGQHPEWMNSMVLLLNPVHNADGNERITLTSRGFQNGPLGGQGTRVNAQGLNINRDHIKLETPEARAMVRLLNDYDPHVMVDLHATNGSRHAYHLTYETPNNPAVDPAIVQQARTWMEAVTAAFKAKDGWAIRSYGNVPPREPERIWRTVEDLPRYSHNYWGLRNRFGILSEAYSYLPFDERIKVSYRFMEEVLNYAHDNAATLRRITEAADAARLPGISQSLRSQIQRTGNVEILMGDVVEVVNPYSGHVMHSRTDVVRAEMMADETTFRSTERERMPAMYFIPADQKAAVQRLRAHGIVLEPVAAPVASGLESYAIATSAAAERPFENHQERTVTGAWGTTDTTVAAGAWRVSMTQPLARLAMYLLEPRSNDSLVTWNLFDEALAGDGYPVLRTRD